MKAPPADQYLHDNSMFEDTESALAISPCPQVDGTSEIRDGTQSASQHSGLEQSPRPQIARQTRFHENELVETLTMGWAIALAIAVALVVYTSGGS